MCALALGITRVARTRVPARGDSYGDDCPVEEKDVKTIRSSVIFNMNILVDLSSVRTLDHLTE